MNDRYLYRAKRTDNGEWVEGHYITNEKDINHAYIGYLFGVVDGMVHDTDIVEVIPCTICQCTGKRDNTRTKEFPEGKLIFEHDIIGFLDTYSTESGYAEQDCIGEVLWDDEELCFYVTERLSAESYEVLDDCKIIGNRFDNPELLEVE